MAYDDWKISSFIPETQAEAQPEIRPTYGLSTWRSQTEEDFLDKIAESFKRGQKLHGTAVYEAMERRPQDLENALRVWKKVKRDEALDPIEGGWFEDILYASARTAGQMWEAIKRGGVGALIGAGVGAAAGGILGLLFPTVGEEPFLIAAGAKIGAKLFGASAAALFTYREGVGDMYATMVDKGITPDLAHTVSHIAGIPYAMIEISQIKTLAPAIKAGAAQVLQKTASNVLKKAIKKYGSTLGTEVLEEIGQEIVQIGAEDVAAYLDKKGIHIDKNYLKERGMRLFEVAKEATKGFALLPIPGTVMETAINVESARMAVEQEALKEKAGTELAEITPDDVQSPVSKLQIALRNSINTYTSQEKMRKAERAKRFTEAQNIRESVEDAKWKMTAKSALKGAYAALGIEPLSEQLPVDVWYLLDQDIRTTDELSLTESIQLSDALEALFKEGKIFRPFEIKLAKKMWGEQVASQLQEAAEIVKRRGKPAIADYLALPKATAASMDISRVGRQNILLLGSPKVWWRGLVKSWHLFLKDEKAARLLEKATALELEAANPILAQHLRTNDWGPGVGYRGGTEMFASRIAGKIPGIERSERAFSAGGNYVRRLMAMEIIRRRQGIHTTEKEWRDIAHVINILTGEGDPTAFGRYAATLNAVFFAPRLVQARIRAITDIFNPNLSWAARKILAYHVVSFAGINAAMLGAMAAVPGVEVERDPRSSDFGKIRIGNMRIDFLGGYVPLMRFVVHIATKQRKTRAGRIVEQPWLDTVTKFLQSKLGPAPAYVLDLLKGETFYGDYVGLTTDSLWEQFYHRFAPLFIQDVIDAVKYQGVLSGAAAAPLAFHGVGVQTYPMSAGTEALFKKNNLSKQVLGKNWDELGPEVQELLKEQFPEIETWERKAQWEQTSYTFLEKIERERADTVERIYENLPPDVRAELDSLKIRPSGISRRLGTDWYLNDSRYREYERNVTKAYRIVLPKLINSPQWNRGSDEMKVELLKMIMDEIKSSIRQQIIMKANLDDFQQIVRGAYGRYEG